MQIKNIKGCEVELCVKKIMAKVLKIDLNKISFDTSVNEVPSWDSLKHIDLIIALEKKFNIQFSDVEVPTMVNFRIITATIQSYLD